MPTRVTKMVRSPPKSRNPAGSKGTDQKAKQKKYSIIFPSNGPASWFAEEDSMKAFIKSLQGAPYTKSSYMKVETCEKKIKEHNDQFAKQDSDSDNEGEDPIIVDDSSEEDGSVGKDSKEEPEQEEDTAKVSAKKEPRQTKGKGVKKLPAVISIASKQTEDISVVSKGDGEETKSSSSLSSKRSKTSKASKTLGTLSSSSSSNTKKKKGTKSHSKSKDKSKSTSSSQKSKSTKMSKEEEVDIDYFLPSAYKSAADDLKAEAEEMDHFNPVPKPVCNVANTMKEVGSDDDTSPIGTPVKISNPYTKSSKKSLVPRSLPGFSSPNSKRQKMDPVLELEYIKVNLTILVTVTLLDFTGKTFYCYKPMFMANLMKTPWEGKPHHVAFDSAERILIRDKPHGPNENKTNNTYDVHALLVKLPCNTKFEDLEKCLTRLGNKILELMRNHDFMEYYLGIMRNTFSKTGMVDQLTNPDHDFWKAINKATVKLVEFKSCDYKFMDETIIKIIPEGLHKVPTADWHKSVITHFYASGELPEGFPKKIGW